MVDGAWLMAHGWGPGTGIRNFGMSNFGVRNFGSHHFGMRTWPCTFGIRETNTQSNNLADIHLNLGGIYLHCLVIS